MLMIMILIDLLMIYWWFIDDNVYLEFYLEFYANEELFILFKVHRFSICNNVEQNYGEVNLLFTNNILCNLSLFTYMY